MDYKELANKMAVNSQNELTAGNELIDAKLATGKEQRPQIESPTKKLSFGQAFAQARSQGLKIFDWNGKKYNTQLKNGTVQKTQKINIPTNTSNVKPSLGIQLPAVTITVQRPRVNYGNEVPNINNFVSNSVLKTGFDKVYNKPIYSRVDFPTPFKKGGKINNTENKFIAYLIDKSGIDNEDDLNSYIQDLGEDGLKKEFNNFQQYLEKGEIIMAKEGAKLDYIKKLRGTCPDGFEMKSFKKGGVICSKCEKKAQAEQATVKKAQQGTKVVQDFKNDMKKKNTDQQRYKNLTDQELKADSVDYAKAYPKSDVAKKLRKK